MKRLLKWNSIKIIFDISHLKFASLFKSCLWIQKIFVVFFFFFFFPIENIEKWCLLENIQRKSAKPSVGDQAIRAYEFEQEDKKRSEVVQRRMPLKVQT